MQTPRTVRIRRQSTSGSTGVHLSLSGAGGAGVVGAPVDEPVLELLREIDGVRLRRPLPVVVEPDDEDYVARTPDLPQLYGSGSSSEEALDMLRREIASVWRDLSADSDLTDEWQSVRDFLADLLHAEQ